MRFCFLDPVELWRAVSAVTWPEVAEACVPELLNYKLSLSRPGAMLVELLCAGVDVTHATQFVCDAAGVLRTSWGKCVEGKRRAAVRQP
jgi:hypothetical protein